MSTDETTAAGGGPSFPRLLIADDDAVVRSTLSAQLRQDFEVIASANDAEQAIALAEEHQPDVALIDVEMPGGGGLEAVRQISKRSPGTCLVMLSADESRTHVFELLSAGAIAYIRKGTSGPEIVKTLMDAMGTRDNG